MKHSVSDLLKIPETLPGMPSWVTSRRGDTLEDMAFLSGAALCELHHVMTRADMPHDLLRARLALGSAEACMIFSGRPERSAELRDAVAFLQPGDLAGPAGDVHLSWQRAVARRVSDKGLGKALPELDSAQIKTWLETDRRPPINQAAMVLETVLIDAPKAELAALILADAVLAKALGWAYLVPLFASGLKRADLRKQGDDLRLACYRAITASAIQAVRLAADLHRRAAHLQAIAPKLRAKQAGKVVEMFLTQDAATPAALPLPDRAARRICDRLVSLGAIRELSGRDTFRLYGV